jgi:xanthine dehydrogenase accessory factor
MLISEDGTTLGTIGGGGMQRLLVKKSLEVVKAGKPRTLHFAMGVPAKDDMIQVDSKCGGEVKIFMDSIKPDPRLVIMGSGVIAQATAQYAKECGFKVIVIDDANTATSENFPQATIINGVYPESLNDLTIKRSDYVAILHGETSFELAGLRKAVKTKPVYIGLLGSANKAREHKKTLKSEGYDPITVDSIKGPIGIEIGAQTPEEIGISIIAEIIKIKHA